jgi:L-histidine Nalpha-methyltransferase
MSTPRFAASPTVHADRKAFAEDLQYYLSLTPRQLPSQYLYDDLGSALFEAICRLPWYPITRIEQQLLAAHASEIFARLPLASTLVELGPGSGEKLRTLLGGAGSRRVHDDRVHDGRAITVHLVDVSVSALETAVRTLAPLHDIVVITHEAPYAAGLAEVTRARRATGRTLALFLGSNIGNFDPPGADAFLRGIRASLMSGDSLLLGADLVKPERELRLAYDDPLGVTAAFNRNLLVRINRELDADFDVDRFSHRAVWNAGASRIEMHLVSARRQRVRIPPSHLDITFEPGETIWTESSYKYEPAEIRTMVERAGFRVAEQWIDDGSSFALTLVDAR